MPLRSTTRPSIDGTPEPRQAPEPEKPICPDRTVDSELSCPVLVAHHMSASSGSVLPRGRGGQAGGLSMPSTGLRRRADLSGVFRISDHSVLVVAADASGSVKDGVGAVGVDVDLDARLDEVRAHRAFRDLQLERPGGDAIVVADLPLLLLAQDLVEIDARNQGEGRAFAGRIDGEPGVVGGQIDLADEGVRRLDIGYAGERELVDETVLKRPEHALRSAPGLRRIGPDMLNPELLERPSHLGGMAAVNLAARLRRVEVMRPAVGVEAHRQP